MFFLRLLDRALLFALNVLAPTPSPTDSSPDVARSEGAANRKQAGPAIENDPGGQEPAPSAPVGDDLHAGPRLSPADCRRMIRQYEKRQRGDVFTGETMAVWPLEDLRDVSGWN